MANSFQTDTRSAHAQPEPFATARASTPHQNALQRRPVVLHLTADYPDAHRRETTLAVKNFVGANDGVDHIVISLNRTAMPWRQRVQAGDGAGDARVISVRYWGLPFGVQLAASMYLLAMKLRGILAERGERLDLIHAHKLSFEGLAGYWLSGWLRVPLVCSIRGEVEEKVFRAKPHYGRLYARVLRHCQHIHYVSAWSQPAIQRKLGGALTKQSLLPNFVRMETIRPRPTFEPNSFASILHLDVYKKKGLDRLLPAFREALDRVPEMTLDLIGRGEAATFARLDHLIEQHGLKGRVRLTGPVAHADLLTRLPDYAGMVLPSHNETFGMAYVEALLSGVPVIYSKGTGIDGYLDDVPAAIGVDPKSIGSIRDGLLHLAAHQQDFRRSLLESNAALRHRFAAERHIQNYNQALGAIARAHDAAERRD